MKDENKLVFREFPNSTVWLAGGLIIFGLIIYNTSRESNLILAVILGGIGLVVLALSQILIITADKNTQILKLRHQGLLWGSTKILPFGSIQIIQVNSSISTGQESDNSTGVSTRYRIEVVLKDGEAVPFRSYYTSGFLAQQNMVYQLNQFIGLPQNGEA